MTTRKANAPSQQEAAAPEKMPNRTQVEERAYYRYLERGRTDGFALDDWLRAEAEIDQQGERRAVS